jgi:hypothetical protein
MLADTTYTYTGKDFTITDGFYTTNDSVHGYFTVVSPLAPDFSGRVYPISISFSDGVQTLTGANPLLDSTFSISTDGSGNIDGWTIWVGNPFALADYIQTTTTGDLADLAQVGGAVNYVGGTWASSAETAATPEPGSCLLIATGALAVAGALRRKRGQQSV